MPVNAGSVEALLTARDNMSPAMQLAAARVQELEYKLGTLGATSVAQFNVMNAQLAVAQERFDKLATSSASATDAIRTTGQASIATGQGVAQLESIATRMIERFLIIAAVRGALKFTEDMFITADALTKTADNLEITTTKLQEWEYAATKTGNTSATLINMVETLNKNLAQGKGSTVDAIDELGLSYDELWKMDPAKRFEAVVTAIAAMPDQLKRAGVEVALFGTDKIDSLVRHFNDLTEAADKSGTMMGDDTVKKLTQSKEAYEDLGKRILAIGAAWLVAAQDRYAYMAMDPEAQKMVGDPTHPPEDISGNPMILPLGSIPDPKKPALPGQLPESSNDPNDKVVMGFLKAAAAAEAAQARVAIAAEQAAEKYYQTWEKAQKQTEVLWDNAALASEARAKQKAKLEDEYAKMQEGLDIKTNKDRLDRGIINEHTYFNNKATIERKYWDAHNDQLQKVEKIDLAILDDKQDKEMAAVEDRYARGLIDEDQYQEQRAAIAEKYAEERLSIEDKFNDEMDIRRRTQLQKEIDDRKAANDKIMKGLDQIKIGADVVNKALASVFGGDTSVNYGNFDNMLSKRTGVGERFGTFGEVVGSTPGMAANAQVYIDGNNGQVAKTTTAIDAARLGYGYEEIISALFGRHLGPNPAGPKIPGFAGGITNFRGGLATVGEQGPETMFIPAGANVYPHGSNPVDHATTEAKSLAIQMSLITSEIALATTKAAVSPAADRINALSAQIAKLAAEQPTAIGVFKEMVDHELTALNKELTALQAKAATDLLAQTAKMNEDLTKMQAKAAYDNAIIAEHNAMAAAKAAGLAPAPDVKVYITVSGILDPSTVKTLTDRVGEEIMRGIKPRVHMGAA